MRLVELSRSRHADLRIRADRSEAAAARQHLVPIVASEFRKAATQYPIVFAKDPDTGHFAPYVLNGLGLEENLFWNGTELDVAYVPLNIRRQPFYVGTGEASAPSVLCIDMDSPCLDESGTRSIINPDGTDSVYLKEMICVLSELVAGQVANRQFIAALLSLDLVSPILLDIVLEDGTPLQLEGLYGLDEEKFGQLDDQAVATLRKAGHLDLVYCVLIASGRIFELIRRKNRRIALGRAWHRNE